MSDEEQARLREDADKYRQWQAQQLIDALQIVCTCPNCSREITLPAYTRTGDTARAVRSTTCICGQEIRFTDKARDSL